MPSTSRAYEASSRRGGWSNHATRHLRGCRIGSLDGLGIRFGYVRPSANPDPYGRHPPSTKSPPLRPFTHGRQEPASLCSLQE